MAEKVRVHIFVSGRVQGVFFRHFTKQHAQALGIGGWVRNLSDGRVEAVFEGGQAQVERLLELVKKGPPLANVKAVDVKFEKPTREFRDFEVRK